MKMKAKKNKKKIFLIVAVIVVLLLASNFFGYRYFTGYYAKGNASQYSPSKTPQNPDSPLQGKTVIFLGSSVTYGMSSRGESFVEFLEKVDGISAIKEAVSGTTLVDNGDKSYIQRMMNNISTNVQADAFVCQLSTNDATNGLPLGEISESRDLANFDTQTITGSMEYIICYAHQTWNCPVLFYTGSYYDSEAYDAMVQRLFELEEKWGITVIDLWTDETFNAIDDAARELYIRPDGIHPYRAGYRDWWLPKFEEGLIAALGE